MIDPGTAAVGASLVAILVGLGGPLLNHRSALTQQRAHESATALARALQIVTVNSQGAADAIFNLTEARVPGMGARDPVTGEPNDPYGPPRRSARDRSHEELAEAEALIAVYGSPGIVAAHERWASALEGVEELIVNADSWYFEGERRATAADFDEASTREREARAQLRELLRSNLRDGRRG